RKNNGKFILRIEDTDVERSTTASVEQILSSLRWLGLDWDEGPFFQSQRMSIYYEHLDRLRREGRIYPAFETREELDAMREEAMRNNTPVYNRASLKLPPEEVQRRLDAGDTFVWRFKAPDEGVTKVPETLLGSDEECSFRNVEIGDFIITRPGTLKNPGVPLYNFVCAVDDAVMQITHVIRGADHLTNTAKQVLLYEAFGYKVPTFTHLPLIMKNNKKMSKRDEDADPRYPVSISARRDLGYLEEALVNFLALLGWSFPNDREFFTREELIDAFVLERLQKSNANFDEDKLLHLNGLWIRDLPKETITRRVRLFLDHAGLVIEGKDDAWYERVISLVLERCRLLSDVPAAVEYFFLTPITYEAKGVKKFFQEEDSGNRLADIIDVLERIDPFIEANMEAPLREYADKAEVGFGKVAQPVRLAVTGRTASPGLFEILEILGKETVLKRLHKALDYIQGRATEEA
ncbi:MAG: glutamate--tRNA ligase, partial [Candidatus Sumerlaeia bacterium]|nr:glutamate--tRNA ligase [Candidatus Sumerlaeia bacterium]